MKIMYYAADYDMGYDVSPSDGKKYREWAKTKLQKAFPEHAISVINDETTPYLVVTDDEDRREEIIDFCHYLWDNCNFS